MAIGETARLISSLELQDRFSGKVGTILGSVGRLQGGLGQMARGTGQVASGLGRVGLAASAAAAGGFVAIVKSASDFEAAFANVAKTVEATPAQLAELNDQFREMARTIPVSFEELSGIGAEAGALGIARKDILSFTDVVARLGVSTNLSTDEAATALGQLGNVLHLSGGEFRDFADSLVNLGNKGASTEKQIVDIAARFGAAGNAAGLSKEEILALSSATASMGIQTEAAGSSLSRLFNSVATNIGTSNDKAQAFAKALGLSAREFRDAWQKDALGTFEDFLTKLNTLDQFQAASLLKKVGITNTRDIATIRLMGQNVGFVSDQLEVARTGQGALNTESQKFFDTASGQWKILVQNIKDAAVTIGNEVLPTIKDLMKQFTDFINRPETRTQLREFGRNLADTIKGIDFGKLVETAKTAVQIAKTAFDIFNALPGPIKAGLIGGVALNRATFGGFGLLLRGAGNIAGGALSTFGGRGAGGVIGGILGGRGSSPANPVFVSMVGGLPGGGPAGGGPSWLSALPWWSGPAAVFAALGVAFVASQNTPADPFLPNDITGGRAAGFGPPSRHFRPGTSGAPGTPDPLLDAQRENNQQNIDLLNEAKAGRLAQAHTSDTLRTVFHSLEQKLIRDKDFKPKIDTTAEFIKLLRRTSEFGRKGVGTTIEQGPKTGRDPVGDAFVALVKRLPKTLLTDKTVSGEISRHIDALEQVQGRLLRQGNLDAARHAQRNINALGRLIGEVDKTLPHFRQLEAKQDRQREQAQRDANQTANHLRTMQSLERRTGDAAIATSQKKWSTSVRVTVPVTTTVSINDVIRNVTHATFAAGSGPGGAPGGIPSA